MEKFLIPSFKKIVTKESKETPNTQTFHVEKLDRGFAQTMGTSLRRTILAGVPGMAAFAIQVKGVQHEFQAIDSAMEDVAELVLNIKELVLSADEKIIEADEVYELKLVSKSGAVKAGQIETPAGIEVVNKNHVIAETSKDGAIDMKIYVMFSKGFRTFEDNKELVKDTIGDKKGIIAIDSNFSPVNRVNFKTQEVNPGESRVFERLVLEVETNGAMSPEKAVAYAAAIMRNYYAPFEQMEEVDMDVHFIEDVEEEPVDAQLSMTIESLNLSVRSENALRAAQIYTVEQLIDRPVSALKDIKNLGEKSKLEIIQVVQDMGLSFKSE